MKIGLAQLNLHIGNFNENVTSVAFEIKKAQQFDIDLLVFPELTICGYPPLDLLEHKKFIEDCNRAIQQVSPICTEIGVLIGSPVLNTKPTGKKLYNSVYFLNKGTVQQVFHKTLLPTYDIFDEYRYFESNTDFKLLQFKGKKIAVTICEDLWYDQPVETDFANSRLYTVNPMKKLMDLKPDLIVNLAASPFSYTKIKAKKEIFINNAKKYKLPVIYLNQVGGQTELLFEGGSLVVDAEGKIVKEMEYFQPDSCFIDADALINCRLSEEVNDQDPVEMIHNALIMGIRDYFGKTGFDKAILGLSGGIDSAVTAVLAVRALGSENVHALLLPSQYSSVHSVSDAETISKNLGMNYDVIDIQNIFNQFKTELQPLFKGLPEDITEENIQSRIRSILLMAFSNKFHSILLNTSNKSEAAVGYGTLYGDMAGGLSVLGDVYKTDVYNLAGFINRKKIIIPENSLTKPPSAELKPDQKDTDSLPEYEILDKILQQYIEFKKSIKEIGKTIGDPGMAERVIKLVNQNEYKRYQSPPILRISSKAFGAGRRMPLVARY